MNELIIAIGLIFVVEGLIYSAIPGSAKLLAREVLKTSEQTLRIGGVVMMVIGVIIVWLVKG